MGKTVWRRREALGAASLGGAAVAASAFPKPAISQGIVEWRMVTTWPDNFPGQGAGAVRFADTVARATDGRLKITVYGAGKLVPALECFDAVASGAADMMSASPYYWQGKTPAMNFFSTVPFGMTTLELQAWIRFMGGQALWDELYDGFGLKPFYGGSTGVQMGGWFNKEINSAADFQGLKIRMPGLGGRMMERLGCTVVNMAAGEIFQALQSGAIDATEFVGPYNDLALGFYQVAQYYYWPGVHEPGTELELTVSKARWNELTPDIQATFETCCRAEDLALTSEFYARNGQALETLVNKHGVQLRRFNDETLVAMGKAAGEVVTDVRDSGDEMTKRVAEGFLAARNELKRWSTAGDYAFIRARGLDFPYPG